MSNPGSVSQKMTRLTVTAAQPIPNAAQTAITWDAPPSDPLEAFDPANPTRLTAKIDKLYLFHTTVIFANSTIGNTRTVLFAKNGQIREGASEQRPPMNGAAEFSISDTFDLIAGDYIEVFAYQDSGAALDTDVVNFGQMHFSIVA